MQLSVRDDDAGNKRKRPASGSGDRCPKIVYGRLSGEIGWQGVNSRIISARKPALAGKGFQRQTIDRPGTACEPGTGRPGRSRNAPAGPVAARGAPCYPPASQDRSGVRT